MRTLAAILTLACLLPMSGQAAEYKQLVADKSSIHFGYKQMGVAMNGRFTRFSAELAVDPAQPAKARAKRAVSPSASCLRKTRVRPTPT